MVGETSRARSSAGQSIGLRSPTSSSDGLNAGSPLPAPIARVVSKFCRSTNWCSPDDIAQEAALASLVAARDWRPGSVPLPAYQALIAHRELIDATRKWGRVANGAEVQFGYVDLSDIPEQAHTPDPERDIDTRRAVDRIREILAQHSAAARAVLLEQWTPDEVAEEFGVPKARVYRETFAAREAVRRRLMELAGGAR